jgi:hypothetical protein
MNAVQMLAPLSLYEGEATPVLTGGGGDASPSNCEEEAGGLEACEEDRSYRTYKTY